MKTKKSILKMTSDYLRSNNANIEDIQKVIEKCEQWIIKNKNRQIESIDKQIDELNKKKEALMQN